MQQSRTIDQTNWLVGRLQTFMSQFGYQTLETPIIDSADLFLTRAGDQIISRLFTFERLGRQLALRPEFTAAAAHAYITTHTHSIARWQFAGVVFEDNGGDFQKTSVGAELFGMSGVAADAEVIAMAAGGLDAVGITGWRVVIGHVQLMRQLLKHYKLDSRTERFLLNHLHTLKEYGKEAVLSALDRLLIVHADSLNGEDDLNEVNTQQMLDVLLDATQRGVTMGGRTRHDIVRRLLQKRQRAAERAEIIAALDFLETWESIIGDADTAFSQIEQLIQPEDHEARQTLESWREMIKLLEVYGIPVEHTLIQPGLARSWDYYTGIVFEIHGDVLLAGGGRYDELAHLIGGEHEIPSVGFAYYLDQIRQTVSAQTESKRLTALVSTSETTVAAVRWAQALRSNGVAVELLPIESSSSGTLIVNADETVSVNGSTYGLDDLNRLLETLR